MDGEDRLLAVVGWLLEPVAAGFGQGSLDLDRASRHLVARNRPSEVDLDEAVVCQVSVERMTGTGMGAPECTGRLPGPMGSLASYRRVFANPALARLFIGEFVSSIGDWLYLVALLVVVYNAGASPVVLGVVGAARIVPYILLSVPAGIAADRFDRRMILIGTDLARGRSCWPSPR